MKVRSLFLTGLRLRWFIKCQLKHVKGRCCVHLRCIKRGHCSTRNSFKYLECESTELHIISWRFFDARVDAALFAALPLSFSVLSLSFILFIFFRYIYLRIHILVYVLLSILFFFVFALHFESRTFWPPIFPILSLFSRSTRPARRPLTYV